MLLTLCESGNSFPGRSSAGCICHFPHSIHLSFSPFITLHLWNPSVLPALNDWLHTRFCLHFMLSIFLFFALNTPHLKWCRGILLPIDLLNAYAYIRLRQFDWQSPSRGGKFKMFWRGLRFLTRTEVPPSGLHNAVTHTEERHGNVKHHLGQKEMQRPWSTSALTDSLLRYFAFLGSPHTSEAEALPSLVGCESRRLATAALVHMCTAGSQTHSHGPLEKKKKKHNQLSTERAELTTSCFSSLLHSRQHACPVLTSSQSVWVHFRCFFFFFFSRRYITPVGLHRHQCSSWKQLEQPAAVYSALKTNCWLCTRAALFSPLCLQLVAWTSAKLWKSWGVDRM